MAPDVASHAVTWTEGPLVSSPAHTALDLTSARTLEQELAGLDDYPAYCRAYREGAGKDLSLIHI